MRSTLDLHPGSRLVKALAGAHGDATARLTRLLGGMSDYSPAVLRLDPRWAPLRGDPRFRRLTGAEP